MTEEEMDEGVVLILEPKTAKDLMGIIHKWLEEEPATDWGDFEWQLDEILARYYD